MPLEIQRSSLGRRQLVLCCLVDTEPAISTHQPSHAIGYTIVYSGRMKGLSLGLSWRSGRLNASLLCAGTDMIVPRRCFKT